MAKILTISPLTRIEGHAKITIHLDEQGRVEETRLQVNSLRGFEKFVEGRPAEEIPRIVNRICGICPWMHHLAAVKAVDAAFSAPLAPAGERLRELCQVLAHIGDKILHFFFLAAPDFLLGPEVDYSVRNITGIVQANPDLAARMVRMRRLVQTMIEDFAGKAIHPVAGVVGGFSRPLEEEMRQQMIQGLEELYDFSCWAMDFAKEKVFTPFTDALSQYGSMNSGFLAMVGRKAGEFSLYDGLLRLMRADGSFCEFLPEHYDTYLAEHVVPWSYAKMPYAKAWQEGFSLDPEAPKGIYRVNTLARLNVCEYMDVPRAQEELEEFRSRFGRPAQQTLLYHYARMIELIYCCEKALTLLHSDAIVDPEVRLPVEPRAGRGVGVVEAPRGTLIHDYTTDANGCITAANLIVGTTHNIGAMNISASQAARKFITEGCDESMLNKVEMAVRAYDP
ncbi:unnamed protein product [Cyprideis torosa]|uniref:Uncharacterized protein n=1 Tax=Cyprideis torosa TaxID=163714 RepID=A0A7R8ZU36_9CRUS|nr:unnamed protein product [Cyprideis torosa]CAG0908424.1 unnamed protein product [Cyprideis torosa]